MGLFEDKEVPLWFKLLNLEDTQFEKSRYADPNSSNKFRLKDLGVLRRLAPGLYEAAVDEVKEHNEYVAQNGKKFNKYKLGKKIGSIPLMEACLHPELMTDKKAQEKYWSDNPGLRCK